MWLNFSFFKWFWLAKIIKGRSQTVRITKGVEMGSKKNIGENVILKMSFCHSNVRLERLINRLWDKTLIHSIFLSESQVNGININDGKIIFNIVKG